MSDEKRFLCQKCGACCKFITFTVGGLSNNRIYKEYFKKHGCEVKGDKVIVPTRCQYLTQDNLCEIHDNKPLLCKMYRGKSDGLFTIPEGCGGK